MKLAYILKWFPKASETFILDEILAHQKAGVSLKIFSLFASPDLVHQDYSREVKYPVVYVPGSSLEEKGAWIAERCDGISHIHAHFAASATSVALLVWKRLGIPYSFTVYGRDVFLETVSRQDVAEKLQCARFCLTVSEYNRDYLRELSPEADIRVHRTGIAIDRFPFNPAPRERFVLGVGRLVAKKGFDILASACPSKYPLHIVGDGPERRNLRGAVLHGFLQREAAYEWISRAGLLVVPCRIAPDGDRDGIPTVLTEGMAAGTPVLATRVAGIPEVCESLVEPESPEKLRVAIDQIMTEPPGQESLWENRNWVSIHCDVDQQTELFRSFL